MKSKLYYNYLSNLTKEQKQSLAKELDTSIEMIRHYYSGYSSLTAQRISTIINWAKVNTPNHIPTFEELLAISETKKVAV